MRLRSLIVVPGLCATALILMAPAAMASYSGDGGITVSNPTPSAGGEITIDSTGWMHDTDVTITLHSDPVVLGTVTADANGDVHAVETIPAGTAAGAHTIELSGTDSDGAPRTVETAITVASGGGSLPRTGAAIAAMVGVAAVLFAAGTALSRARKRVIN
jgi:hypothetical protein